MLRQFRIGFPAAMGLILASCGVPNFDIPNDADGMPTISTIVQRVTCELVELIDDQGPDSKFKGLLLTGDYQVAVALSLQVTDSGELSPNFNFPTTSAFSFNTGVKIAKSREQNFSRKLRYSMKALNEQLKQNRNFNSCPDADTNLSGELGIKNAAFLALSAPYGDVSAKVDSGTGEFGGYVNFVVTNNINATGPTWKLVNFEGPGKMGALSRINTDKLTFAFAPGTSSTGIKAASSDRAEKFLDQLLLSQINSTPAWVPGWGPAWLGQ